ncbi:MAG TPA: YkgJ family cysteine cluster protein [Parachlamydiaceae bacterium]|nr:YkgJ family cysteine cluster protein [Parachlamydiaceae bacterium]
MTDPLNILKNDDNNEIWYKDGLKFQCTGCGKCCTGSPGVVFVTEEEMGNMASFLKITAKDFAKRYMRTVNGRLALVELRQNYDCIFLKNNKCSIYEVRPKQCRTFPWWAQNLNSKESWKDAALYCEGISQDAPTVPFETIQEQLFIQSQ